MTKKLDNCEVEIEKDKVAILYENSKVYLSKLELFVLLGHMMEVKSKKIVPEKP